MSKIIKDARSRRRALNTQRSGLNSKVQSTPKPKSTASTIEIITKHIKAKNDLTSAERTIKTQLNPSISQTSQNLSGKKPIDRHMMHASNAFSGHSNFSGATYAQLSPSRMFRQRNSLNDQLAIQFNTISGSGAMDHRFPASNLTVAAAKRKLTVNESIST